MDIFEKTSVPYVSKVLDVLSERQRVIADNVANVNTPGFRAKRVDFQSVLDDISQVREEHKQQSQRSLKPAKVAGECVYARRRQDSLELKLKAIEIDKEFSNPDSEGMGVNDVNIHDEMVNMSTNALLFKAYTRILRAQMRQLRVAITEKA